MSRTEIDQEFFSAYDQTVKEKEKGIPRLEMNMPLARLDHKGTIGLELEIEGNRLPSTGYLEKIVGSKTRAGWNATTDGSLRGEALEYVLTRPCDVSELPTLVDGLWDVFKARDTTINNSNRCSTHVHINMGGKKVNEATSVLALWATFEEALINWCGEERKTNHFCLGTKDAQSTVAAWQTLLKTGSRPTDRGLKYSALNILPLWNYGSFEFRCGAAAEEPKKVIQWAQFLHHFVEYACTTYNNPQDLAYALSEQGGETILKEICAKAGLESFADEVIKGVDNFDRTCMEGFRHVQHLCMGHPWQEWIEIINRPYVPDPFGKKKTTFAEYAAAPRLRRDLRPAIAEEVAAENEPARPRVILQDDEPERPNARPLTQALEDFPDENTRAVGMCAVHVQMQYYWCGRGHGWQRYNLARRLVGEGALG